MNTSKPSKQPRPSYEDGKARDPHITEMQSKGIERGAFFALVKKATRVERDIQQRKEDAL